MMRALGNIPAGEANVGNQFGGERVLPRPFIRRVGNVRRHDGRRRDLRAVHRPRVAQQFGRDALAPFGGGVLKVHIAFHRRRDSLRAEFGEALVHVAAGFAKMFVAAVAQRQHRVSRAA